MAWFSRKKMLVPVLAVAAGGPFVALDDGWKPEWLKDSLTSVSSLSGSANSLHLTEAGDPANRLPATANSADPLADAPLPVVPEVQEKLGRHGNFAHYIRFDLAPNQVFSAWNRVTTVLSESQLEGLRVALVTGAAEDDVAGSLTYYFDKQHRVQRITFYGTSGDPSRFVQFITETFGFQSQPTLDAGLYVSQWNGQPTSALRVLHAPVVRAEESHARYSIQLEINRPYVPYQFKLTPPNEKQLRDGYHTGRW